MKPTLVALQAGVATVLLIAALNTGNLMLVRGSGRSRELAVRAACGSSRHRLIQILFVEATVLTAIGAAAGLGVGALAVRGLLALAPPNMPMIDAVNLDVRAVAFAAVAACATTLVAGLVPSLRSTAPGDRSRDEPGGGLQDASLQQIAAVPGDDGDRPVAGSAARWRPVAPQ